MYICTYDSMDATSRFSAELQSRARASHAHRALVGPPMGLSPGPSPGPSPGLWWSPAGALGPPEAQPGLLQPRKNNRFQHLKTLNISNRIVFPGKTEFQGLETSKMGNKYFVNTQIQKKMRRRPPQKKILTLY